MYIHVDENNIVTTIVRQTKKDGLDVSLLVDFIEVPDEEVVAGMIYDSSTGTYSARPANEFEVRRDRDFILQGEVDPIVTNPLRWNNMSAEEQQQWSDYRQALLDITEQEGFPTNVTWPTKP